MQILFLKIIFLCNFGTQKQNNIMDISIYTLTSQLHDEKVVDAATAEFLGSLNIKFDFIGSDFTTYGDHALNLIYVRTGGTEGIFKKLLPQIQANSKQPIYLLTSGKSNSLAASMEILSYLRLNNIKGEIYFFENDLQIILRRIDEKTFFTIEELLLEILTIGELLRNKKYFYFDLVLYNYLNIYGPYLLYTFNDKGLKSKNKKIKEVKSIFLIQINKIICDYTLCLKRII